MTELIPTGGLVFDRPTLEPLATEMARVYSASVARIVNAMTAVQEACEDLAKCFCGEGSSAVAGYHFNIGFNYGSRNHATRDEIFDKMKRTAWEVIVNRLGIKNVMSMEDRKKFEKQLAEGDLPEITPECIINMVMGMAEQVETFAVKAVREAFEFLRNRGNRYVTNKKYRVGKRVILEYACEQYGRGHFSPSYHKDDFFRAIDGVMLLLDGKTPLRDGSTSINEAIRSADITGRTETEYFKLRCFKNRNVHFEFKRLDLLRELNRIATGSAEIGEDER